MRMLELRHWLVAGFICKEWSYSCWLGRREAKLGLMMQMVLSNDV